MLYQRNIMERFQWVISSFFLLTIIATQGARSRRGASAAGCPAAHASASATCPCAALGEGTNGVSTGGVTASFDVFDGGTFWVLALTYFCLPKSARVYLFPQSDTINYFCSGLINVDPICPQPSHVI